MRCAPLYVRLAVRPLHHRRTLCTASLPRLYTSPLPSKAVELCTEESRHATRVLRLQVGDECELFDGAGGLVRSRLVHVDARGGATVEPCADAVHTPWSGARWDLAVSCSGLTSRSDWLVEKAAELGVHAFLPLLTERSPASKQRRAEAASECARWERLSLAASKQCLRLHLLQVRPATTLSDLLPAVSSANLTLVALQGGRPLREVLGSSSASETGGLLVVGPPGDFSEAEKEALLAAGALGVGLGSLRLRTETAALALAAATLLY